MDLTFENNLHFLFASGCICILVSIPCLVFIEEKVEFSGRGEHKFVSVVIVIMQVLEEHQRKNVP